MSPSRATSSTVTPPTTLGELRASGWRSRTVKEELRSNLLARLGEGEAIFPGVVGFDDTVLPAVENAILAGQDVILLSEEKGFRPTVAEISQPYVKAEILPAGDKDKIPGRTGDQFKVHINVLPDAPEGLLNAPIRIATGVTQQPTIEIPVSGIVRPRVSVTPVTVNFGNFTAGKDPITRNIIVTNNKPAQPVKVMRAEVSVPGFVTDIVPTQEGVSYTVVVKASDKIKKGALDGMVKLYTSDKERAVIEIPLRGEVL